MSATWTFDWSLWKLAAGGTLLLAAVWLSAWNVRRERKGRTMVLLECVRLLAVTLIAVTLLRPERVRLIRHTERPQVAVLCDASGSMATRDVVTGVLAQAGTRADWLAQARERKAWAPLEAAYRVATDTFAAPPARGDGAADPGTDLNGALEEALRRADRLRAVLLLSDGDWNQGNSPVAAATRLRLAGVPVYAVAVGSDRYLPDLELQSVAAPAYGLMDEHISIPFTVQSRLPREVRTAATLEGPMGVAARKELVIPPMAQVQGALVLVPKVEGDYRFKLQIPVEPEETQAENNAREFPMSLRREKLKVLVADSVPRWEFRYLRNALVRDPGTDVSCLLLHPGMEPGGGPHYLAAFPGTREELSKYDVVFVGDLGVGTGQLSEENARQLKGLVEQQGSGLVFLPGLGGREASLAGTALADLMPVVLDDAHPTGFGQTMESRLTLTTRGRDHLLTLLAPDADANEAVWKGLPGFSWYAPALRAKPGADVLAVHAEARNEFGRIPLLVTRAAGNGKVLFMGTDSAWRWRRGVEDVYHYRFWGQVVRWMAHQRHLAHAEGIRFFYSPESPALGDRVFLHATAFDAAGLPLERGTVAVTVKDEGGREEQLELTPEPGGWGIFTGSVVPREGGRHELTVRCKETGRTAQATVAVSRPRTEKVGRPARPEVLEEIAAITGGRVGMAAELDRIVDEIKLLPEPRPEEERFRLWCHPGWGAFVVGLLCAYWIGRKLAGTL